MNRHRFRIILTVLLAGSLLFSGCAGSKYGEQKTRADYYPQCYKPVSDLRQDEGSEGGSTVAGGVTGALLGALVGALATGKVEGALAGAAVGGATGAVAGNIYGKNQSRQRDEAYYQAYARQLGAEAAGMSRATAAAKVAAKCYDEQFRQAVGQFRAGQMDRVEFQQRYDEIRSGLEETSYILGSTANTMARKDSEYQQALAEQYTEAKPVAPKSKAAQKADANKVTDQAKTWKGSRQELENTRQDVDSRLNAYSQTVDNLLL
ncbi:MAG: glycine zipper domain-containing protein [Desulfovibrionaceae bacterium]|nr:glycine zipper domain-containing protein [Desulfovibrionaceae bacterium]